jgi:hypothetical protein
MSCGQFVPMFALKTLFPFHGDAFNLISSPTFGNDRPKRLPRMSIEIRTSQVLTVIYEYCTHDLQVYVGLLSAPARILHSTNLWLSACLWIRLATPAVIRRSWDLRFSPSSERMIVDLFCIACHRHLDSYPAKNHILSARIIICDRCIKRKHFRHLVRRRDGILGLAAAMALMNPSYNFRQYEDIAAEEWPKHNEDICKMLCHPVASILDQNVFSRIFRKFQAHILYVSPWESYRPIIEGLITNFYAIGSAVRNSKTWVQNKTGMM